jgi:hypothetical protein
MCYHMHWETDVLAIESAPHLKIGHQAGLALLLDVGQQAEGLRGSGHAVAHQLELSVGRNKRDGPLRVELPESYTPVRYYV